MTEPDELFSLRNLFHVGNFQQAIAEAETLSRLPPHLKNERDEILYRAHIAMGNHEVALREISDDPNLPVSLRAVKLLATFMHQKDMREVALMQLQEWMQDSSSANDTTLQMVAATMRLHNDETMEAIKVLGHGTTLEHCALLVQLYLRIDRVDLAQKQLRQMQQADEDAALSQLATAWVAMALGGAKFQEAVFILEEFVDKFGGSAMIFNSLAVANMQMGNFEDAERNLQDALSKDPKNADALANLICVTHHLARGNELVTRYLNQLRAADAEHPLLASLATLDSAFERVAATMAH